MIELRIVTEPVPLSLRTPPVELLAELFVTVEFCSSNVPVGKTRMPALKVDVLPEIVELTTVADAVFKTSKPPPLLPKLSVRVESVRFRTPEFRTAIPAPPALRSLAVL